MPLLRDTDGRPMFDVGDDVRVAIVRRMQDELPLIDRSLSERQVHHLSMFIGATVRALLAEIATLKAMTETP